MKQSLFERLTIALFCLFLAGMGLGYLLCPKQEFSELEKRYLAEPPQWNWAQFSTGTFGEETEGYLADHIPGRNFFVGLNAYFSRWTLRRADQDIYVAAQGRLVEAPVHWSQTAAQKNMSAVNRFVQQTQADAALMLIPSGGWAAEKSIAGPARPYRDRELIQRIYAMAEGKLDTVDILDEFEGRSDWFFRTDHHWNSQGAYQGYRLYQQSRGRAYVPEELFTPQDCGAFRGSTYSRSALWLTEPEELSLLVSDSLITVTNLESNQPHEGPYYWERLEQSDKYTVNLDGNHSLVRLTNPQGVGKLLVIRDSFANSMGVFLAESYETVVLVDLRYYKEAVSDLISQEGFDSILICYSLSNFLTDNNLLWLR